MIPYNKTRRNMSKISRLTIIVLGLLFTTSLHAQENNNLFTYTDAERSSLSATAEELLNNIESKKQVKGGNSVINQYIISGQCCDEGKSYLTTVPDSPATKAYIDIINSKYI